MKDASIGLRARLLLLVLLAVIPPFGVIAYNAINQRHDAAVNAEKDAMHLVRLVSREQARLITATHGLLADLAELPAVRRPSAAAACNRALVEIKKSYPFYTNLGVAAADGDISCSAVPLAQPVNIADRSYFRRAVRARGFGIGDYQIGRITQEPAVNFGYPILGAEGDLQGVVYAALSLGWLEQVITGELPAGSSVTVIDGSGTVLAHYPDSAQWRGKSLRVAPLVDAVLSNTRASTVRVQGLDEEERLYAFAPLHEGAAGNVYVAAGIPTAVAFAAANRDFTRSLVLLGAAAILVLAAARYGSSAFVLRRVNALADAVQRLGKGDLGARTGLPHDNTEFGRLAHRFDDMAAALQRVNRALKTLSAGNRTLVRAVDEQALLTEMCRVIVDIGGYRFAWIGYAERDERKTVRLVAQAGFEGGLEALMKMVGEMFWADTERGRGPSGTAIRTGTPFIARNLLADPNFAPWREAVGRHGIVANATFPLSVEGNAIGALAIFSQDAHAFDAEELELLKEAADDLAFGIAVLRTRVESARAQATIQRLAYYDRLTGLPNHAQFEERVRRELYQADLHGRLLALAVFDLDRLREINDALGFHHGDLLLKDVGTRLRSLATEEQFVARMRGDEFGVLIPADDAAQAASAVRGLLDAMREPFAVGGLHIDVGAVAGVSLFPQQGADATHLLRCADVALQQAKRAGEDYAFYSSEQDGNSAQRLALAGELRHAIEAGELILHYQPKVDVASGGACGAEVLVRWIHPRRGTIQPDEFISLAERTGLIKPLTDWVMAAALGQAAAWHAAGMAIPVAVNLSTRNLRDVELLDKIEQLLLAHDAGASWLELEITEGAVMENPEGALQILTRLSDMGIKLFIDDFGTGYSSLGYLQKLPVDAIKIDKSFVADMLTSRDSAAIVRSTIALAHDLEMKVVAEGVENEAMLAHLTALGCDAAQGYHFSRPLPAEQFQSWWEQSAGGSAPAKQTGGRGERR